MPLDQNAQEELKANIGFARKRELAFGLCLGKSAETTILACHKTKDPETVGRQAKKDGETNKVAYGMMTVDGKNLNLSCQGDVPSGMARKTREMLKLAGLNLKVRILDAQGNTIEEDGDDEDGGEGGAAADPLTEEWNATKARVTPLVETARALPPGEEILADWQAAVARADEGDLRGALMAVEAVERRIAEAEAAARNADADRARWEEAAPKLAPMIAELQDVQSPAASKVAALWSVVQGKVSGPAPDYAAAVKSIAMLVKLIQEARNSATVGATSAGGGSGGKTTTKPTGTPPSGTQATGTAATGTPPTGAPPNPTPQPGAQPTAQAKPAAQTLTPPAPNASDKEKFDYAEAQLKAIDTLIADYLAVIPGSTEATPAAWTAGRAKIDAVLAPMRGGKIDPKKVADAIKGIDLLAGVIKGKLTEKTAWKKTLDLVNLRLVPLDRHAEAASAPQIAPKIAAIKAEIAKAVAKANAQDFKGANSLVAPLAARCDTVEKLADDFAHYKSILAQRQATVGAATATPSAVKEVEKLQKAIPKLLADADKLARSEKYGDAIKKLDQIPPVFDQYRRLNDQVGTYTWAVGELDTIFQNVDTWSADVRAPFQKQIDRWKKDFAAAKFPKTKDYAKSVSLLLTLIGIVRTNPADPSTGTPEKKSFLDKELEARDAYVTALKDFEAQFAIFKAHKGRSGIEAFYLGMEKDLAQGKAEGASGKFSTGAAILERSRADWPTQKTLADDCEAYLTKRDEVAKTIAGLKSDAKAASVLAQAEGLMATAAKQALAKDFVTAKATVEEAAQRAADAKAAADAQGDLAKLKDGKALDGIAADFDKAMKVFTDMRANVAGRDPAGTFASLLAKADAEAQKARDEKAKPAPNYGTAKGNVEAAIAILESTLPKVMASGPFQTHLTEAKSLTAGLVALNLDNCITPQMTAANTLITEAETLARAPDFKFPEAEAKLVAAREGAQKAKADAALWPQIKADRADIDTAKTDIEAVPLAAAKMGPTLTRLQAALTGIDTKVAAQDFAAAAKIAADAAAAAAQTADDLITVQTILTEFANIYTANVGKVTGPDSAKAQSQVDILNAKLAQHNTALAAGNYDTALNLIYEMKWAIDAGVRILGEHTAYEAARAIAEGKVNALAAVRHPQVEAEVKAIEKRYADGVALSAKEKHKPAETIMLALPADCDKLIATAGDWKAFDDARTAALAKITALETHPQAAAVKPMATALRGKLTAAVAMTTKGDLKGAKTLLDTIPAEADTALATANATGAVAAKADQLGNDPIDPALLAEAQKLYDDLAAKTEAPSAKTDLDEAKKQLDLAKAPTTEAGAAKTALKAAMEACTKADVKMGQQKSVNEALAAVRTELGALKSHAQAVYIAAEIGVIETEIDAIVADTAKNGPDAAGARVRTLNERCAAAKVLADKQAEYVALRASPEVEPRLKVLEEHAHRYAIKPSIDAFRKKLDAAAQRSAAKEPAAAIKLLEEGQTIAGSAFVLAQMRANTKPKVEDIKKILNGPGGQAELDVMIDQLEPDAQREVLVVAFEARFGCKLETFTGMDAAGKPINPTGAGAAGVLDGPNIKRFYDIMSKLPKDHVVDNDSMRKFTSIEDGGQGSYYSGDDKDVVMREGDAVLSSAYGFGREHEVGGADDNCKPANNEEVPFFSWNTLHEVGHAVDDKTGFMDRNQGGPAYGGWTTYSMDTQTIAEAIKDHFKYDATYIGQFLARRTTPPIPPVPDTCTPEEWEARRIKFEAWAATAFTGNDPWTSNSTAAKIAIGGVVYQESYDFRWTSYSLGARKQGMTGYQFRAPGEWFAELYAAYHSGKLKPNHPAVGWLSTL